MTHFFDLFSLKIRASILQIPVSHISLLLLSSKFLVKINMRIVNWPRFQLVGSRILRPQMRWCATFTWRPSTARFNTPNSVPHMLLQIFQISFYRMLLNSKTFSTSCRHDASYTGKMLLIFTLHFLTDSIHTLTSLDSQNQTKKCYPSLSHIDCSYLMCYLRYRLEDTILTVAHSFMLLCEIKWPVKVVDLQCR